MKTWMKYALIFALVMGPQTWLLFNHSAATNDSAGEQSFQAHAQSNSPVIKGLTVHNGLVQSVHEGTVDPANMTTTGVQAGSYGSTALIPGLIVNSTGQITSATGGLYHSAPNAINTRNSINGAPGSIGDGNSHPLSGPPGNFTTIAAAKTAYPGVWIDNLNDETDYCAIQLAMNTAGANGKVYVPGCNQLSKPLVSPGGNFELYGDGLANPNNNGNPSLIPSANGNSTPLLLLIPPNYPTISLGAASLPGAGGSYALGGSNQTWLNFADFGYTSTLSRISNSFCFDCMVNFTSWPTSGSTLSAITGTLRNQAGSEPSLVGTFQVNVNTDQTITISYCIGGVNSSFRTNPGALTTLATWHHFEVDLSAGQWYLFVDGVRQTKLSGNDNPGAGNLTIVPYLDVMVGPICSRWPETQPVSPTITGFIDCVRYSNSFRHTANFTPPTAKPSPDATTVYLCNFDIVNGYILGVYVGNTTIPSYTWQRSNSFGGGMFNNFIHDLYAKNNGFGPAIVAVTSATNRYENIQTLGSFGLYCWLNTYQSRIERSVLAGTTAALVLANQSVGTRVKNCSLNTGGSGALGAGFGVVSVNGGQFFDNLQFQFNYIDIFTNLCQQETVEINSPYFDHESTPFPQGVFYFADTSSVRLAHAQVYQGNGTGTFAPITMNGCDNLVVDNSYISAGGSAPVYAVNAMIAPAGRIVVTGNSTIVGNLTAWANNLDYVQFVTVDGTPLVHQTSSAGTVALNLGSANSFQATLANGAQTITASNAVVGQKFSLAVQQPATGAAGTVSSWFSPATVRWKGGSAPTLTATNGAIDVIDVRVLSSSVYLATANLNY